MYTKKQWTNIVVLWQEINAGSIKKDRIQYISKKCCLMVLMDVEVDEVTKIIGIHFENEMVERTKWLKEQNLNRNTKTDIYVKLHLEQWQQGVQLY